MFRIQSKLILGTFGTDYLDQINCEKIFNIYSNKKDKDGNPIWEILIVKAHGDEEIKHDHYHFWCFYKGNYKPNITSKTYFDVPIEKEIYMFEEEDGTRIYYFKNEINQELLKERIETSKSFSILKIAHPNLKTKFNKNKGAPYDTLKYCWDQQIEYKSNFNVEEKLEELKAIKEKQSQSEKKKIRNENKAKLLEYIRQQYLIGKPKNEVINFIMKKPEYSEIYLTTAAIQNSIEKIFNQLKPIQPIPQFGKYWVPLELKEFFDYLNDFTKSYHEEVIIPCNEGKFETYEEAMECYIQKHKDRAQSIIISGKGGIGKTNLIACFGDCSYFKDRFNYDQWNNWGFFNWFDDVDIFNKNIDLENGKLKPNDWEYLKAWIGGQYQCSFSGKYRSVKTVVNAKPCIFVTNDEIEDRFSSEALKYMDDIGVKRIRLEDKLFEPKDTRSIGGFARWREINTKNYYFYNNIYRKRKNINNDENEESNKRARIVLENDEEPSILIEDKDAEIIEEIVRPNSLASSSNFVPNENNWLSTYLGLDGSNYCVAKKSYYKNYLKNIKDSIGYHSDKLIEYNNCLDLYRKEKEKYVDRYNECFDKFLLKTKYKHLNVKELEDLKFFIINTIRELNDEIINYEKLIDNSCDQIELLCIEFTQVENLLNKLN